MAPEVRTFSPQVRTEGDGRTIIGRVAPYGEPARINGVDGPYQETFVRGSFLLDGARAPLHVDHPQAGRYHDERDMAVSPPGEFRERDDGLYGAWHLPRSDAADALLDAVNGGRVSALSVGFLPGPGDDWNYDRSRVTRHGARLDHVAAVVNGHPYYEGARIMAVRSQPVDVAAYNEQIVAYNQRVETRNAQRRTRQQSIEHPGSDDPWPPEMPFMGVPMNHPRPAANDGDEPDTDTDDVDRTELSGAAINDLPDSAFAYIEPGGKRDKSGRTTPRSLRHFPVHDKAHARNALARLSQSPFGAKAKSKVLAAARKFGIEVSSEHRAHGVAARQLVECRGLLYAEQEKWDRPWQEVSTGYQAVVELDRR
jgi:HK97 family phage prohead protease